MHAFGPNEFVRERTAGFATEEYLAEFSLGAVWHGGYVEVLSEGFIQGRSGILIKSVGGFIRDSGSAVSSVALQQHLLIYSGGGVAPYHDLTIVGSIALLRLVFDATGTGSVMRHYVKTEGVKALVKQY